MKNKVVIVDKNEIAIAGEIYSNELVENGVIIQPSDKSNIKYWFLLDEIKKIILPDASEVNREDYGRLHEVLEIFNKEYELED